MTRAKRIEEAAARLLAPREGGFEGLPFTLRDPTRCLCGCDPDVEALRSALALPEEESVDALRMLALVVEAAGGLVVVPQEARMLDNWELVRDDHRGDVVFSVRRITVEGEESER